MESVNVLTTPISFNASIGDECLRQIAAVSPRVKVTDVTDLFNAEKRGDSTTKEEFDALLAETEILTGFRPPKNVIARAPKLKWFQSMLAGVDDFLTDDIRQSPVILTHTSHASSIGEVVFEMMLMFVKQAPLYFRLKQEKQWKRFMPTMLRSKTVGIVGLGSTGQEVARLAKAFSMRVVATRRSAKRATRYVDLMLPREQLPRLLSESDFVVLTLPLTPETNKLIGEKELRTMKPTAYLINVARGKIVDDEALIRALDEHWIAGAGIDAFTTEPLPADSKLWELPNVILSPHIAGVMEDISIKATELFCENLRRYLSGQKLLNVVNKKRGY